MNDELWLEPDGEQTFCLASPQGEDARKLLHNEAVLTWRVEASNHFEAMSQYYSYMGWGDYQTDFPEQDKVSYKDLDWE